MLCSPSAIPTFLVPSEIYQRVIKAVKEGGGWCKGVGSAFGKGAELHPGPWLLWEGMAKPLPWLSPLLEGN